MSRLTPETVALRTLRDEPLLPRCRITREQALDYLKTSSGCDFGDDADKWAAWLRVRPATSDDHDAADRLGVVKAFTPGGECRVELDDGGNVLAIVPRTVLRRMGFAAPGMRVVVRSRPLGCAQIVGAVPREKT